MVDPFKDDGCTGFLDGIGEVVWRHCCEVHDPAFLSGVTIADFIRANEAFQTCIETSQVGIWWLSPLSWIMWTVVAGPVGFLFFKRGKWK